MNALEKIKLLVCDMDGTLTYEENENAAYTPSKKGLPERNHQAITQFIEEGGLFCVATGRLLADVQAVLGDELFGKSYKIAQNGSFALDTTGNLLAKDYFSKEQSQRIYKKLRALDLPFACSTMDQHTYEKQVTAHVMQQVFGDVVTMVQVSERTSHPEHPANICVVREESQDLRADLKKLQEVLSGEDLNFQITSPHTIDINPLSVNKGNAVGALVRQLGLEVEEVAVVGDSYNDLSMFKRFPHTFAMAHAEADVKAHARYQVRMVADVFSPTSWS